MATVKSVKKTQQGNPAKPGTKGTKNGAPKIGGAKRVQIAGGSGRIPNEILETLGPACPGAVELLIADRNR